MRNLMLTVALLLGGCQSIPINHSGTEGGDYTYDPEIEACQFAGGEVKLLSDDQNLNVVFCNIGRALIGAESLRSQQASGVKTQAVILFQEGAKPAKRRNRRYSSNPASSHCRDLQGEPAIYRDGAHRSLICELADGSTISAWTLFNGPQAAGELARSLAPANSYRVGRNIK